MAVSYRQACSALNYRFYRGTGSLNPYVREWETKRSAYPVKEERGILEAILLQDSKALEKAVNGFRQSLGTPEKRESRVTWNVALTVWYRDWLPGRSSWNTRIFMEKCSERILKKSWQMYLRSGVKQ